MLRKSLAATFTGSVGASTHGLMIQRCLHVHASLLMIQLRSRTDSWAIVPLASCEDSLNTL